MKHALVAALALAMATPVISIPTASDAQVLTRGASRPVPRRPRAEPPRLTNQEQDSLYEAQDLITDLNTEIGELQRLGAQQGSLTPEQRTQIEAHTARRTEAEATVARLVAKRGY